MAGKPSVFSPRPLYDDLGNGAHEKWEDQLLHKIEAILDMDRNSIEKLSSFNLGEVNLLNYILSSSNVTPGYTDRTLSDWTSNKTPFESWILDENQLYSSINHVPTWISDDVRKIDLNPPKPILFPSEIKLRQKILKQKVLFTCAEDDVFVPMQGYLNSLKKFYIEDCTTIEILKGGHHAIFLEQGHQVLNKWIEDVGY